MRDLIERLSRARVFDLSQTMHAGIPHFPTHPPFAFTLTRLHGDTVAPGGASSTSEAISLGTHNGTHIDALGHFSRGGEWHGGIAVEGRQSYTEGIAEHTVESIQPLFRRGILLDFPALETVPELPADYEVTPTRLEAACARQQVAPLPGDVVLVRTGWARRWADPRAYVNNIRLPGPKRAGAHWLSAHGVFACGSDTLAFEFMPSPEMEVHVHLLVEQGIHIIENLNLDELAGAGASEFLFVAAPLRLRGATGSPIRALALLEA